MTDRDPAIVTDHGYRPVGEWWGRCVCGLAQAAHQRDARPDEVIVTGSCYSDPEAPGIPRLNGPRRSER